MEFRNYLLSATASVILSLSGAANADPALVYDIGGKFDKSFNESAFQGAEKWAEETGEKYIDVEIQSAAQREQALRRFAISGANPIVMAGFSFAAALEEVAPEFPETKFVIIDMVVDKPNVKSVVFNEHEGSYLVGVIAGMATKTNTVSFIGGMDIPLIRKFACGFAQGVKFSNPSAKVLSNMTGTTPHAWNDPVKGSELTLAQISQGSDVVFAAAGGTGVGVLQAAADNNILSIGVDNNQNHLHPGKVLTSMLKRVDNAVYEAFKDGDAVKAGINAMGIVNGGVGYALDDNNRKLITAEMTSAVEQAATEISSGAIKVHDYSSDETCSVLEF